MFYSGGEKMRFLNMLYTSASPSQWSQGSELEGAIHSWRINNDKSGPPLPPPPILLPYNQNISMVEEMPLNHYKTIIWELFLVISSFLEQCILTEQQICPDPMMDFCLLRTLEQRTSEPITAWLIYINSSTSHCLICFVLSLLLHTSHWSVSFYPLQYHT